MGNVQSASCRSRYAAGRELLMRRLLRRLRGLPLGRLWLLLLLLLHDVRRASSDGEVQLQGEWHVECCGGRWGSSTSVCSNF